MKSNRFNKAQEEEKVLLSANRRMFPAIEVIYVREEGWDKGRIYIVVSRDSECMTIEQFELFIAMFSKLVEIARRAKNRVEERITNQRDAWQWQQAHELCRKYDTICIEDLQLTGMTKFWGRKMQDLAHGKMIAKLEYLAHRYGVTVRKIDRYFPSSKLCDCGHIHNSLSLHDREWTCPVCGQHHDRDLHAANNILRQGIASLESPCKTRKPAVATVRGRRHPRISSL